MRDNFVPEFPDDPGAQEHVVVGLHSSLELPALHVTIPLVEIYRWTPIE